MREGGEGPKRFAIYEINCDRSGPRKRIAQKPTKGKGVGLRDGFGHGHSAGRLHRATLRSGKL